MRILDIDPFSSDHRQVISRSAAVALVALVTAVSLSAQSARRPAARRAAAPAKKTASADVACPSPLGAGVRTKLSFCDVLTGRDPANGIIIKLPPHRGAATLRFDLHNRHTYSEDEMRAKKGFAAYTASIGTLTPDNTLLARAVVASEFRTPQDLLDRVTGGAGPGGVKAVAPIGTEHIVVEIPAGLDQVSILGEKLTIVRSDGEPQTYSAPGRPIAIISNVNIEYTPAPTPTRRR